MHADGTVTRWLQQTTAFFIANAGVHAGQKVLRSEPVPSDHRLGACRRVDGHVVVHTAAERFNRLRRSQRSVQRRDAGLRDRIIL